MKINTNLLIQILKMTQAEVKSFVTKELRQYGYRPVSFDGGVYAEGIQNICMVAHMDTVHVVPKYIIYNNGYMSAHTGLGADDRAGVYGILHLLEMGHRPHILFTEDEEKGCIGAGKIVKTNIQMDVNYFIELDRQGSTDCVFYDCDNSDFTKYVESFGFKTAMGSFSDISELCPHYGVAGVNLSVGYYGQHTRNEVLSIGELKATLSKVSKMLDDNTSVKFEYIEKVYSYSKYGSYSYMYDKWDDWYSSKISKLANTTITSTKQDRWVYDDVNKCWIDTSTTVEISNEGYQLHGYNVHCEDFILITDGILMFDDGRMLDYYSFTENYYLGIDDSVYTEDGMPVDAYLVDADFQYIGFYQLYVKN